MPAGFSKSKIYGSGMPDSKSKNTVSLIVANTKPISLGEMEEGSFVTFRTGRKDHQGPNGKYDHIAIVTKIERGDDGNINGYYFIHSAGNGAIEMYYDLTKEKHTAWGNDQLLMTGIWKWDNEEMYSAKPMQPFDVDGGAGAGMSYLKPKSISEIPIQYDYSIGSNTQNDGMNGPLSQ